MDELLGRILSFAEAHPAVRAVVLTGSRARAFSGGGNGREMNLAFYREGDFFGELSILNNAPRAASVEAFTDCQLLALEPKAAKTPPMKVPAKNVDSFSNPPPPPK